MNTKLALIGLVSISFTGAYGATNTDPLEKAITQHSPTKVRTYRDTAAKHGIKLTVVQKAQYLELANAEVEKTESKRNFSLSGLATVEGITGIGGIIMTAGGIFTLVSKWQDPKPNDEWTESRKAWLGAFITLAGQAILVGGATIYKNLFQVDKAKDAHRNAKKVLELVETLPTV
jgi:hypothetical protein